mgnify:CR=1 FL=1
MINSFGKVYFDQKGKEEELAKRADFIKVTKRTLKSIEKAIQFLYEEVLLFDYRLLPYGTQLVFITDFFNTIENPTKEQLETLKKWFWQTTYASYFTIYSLSKQREAYNTFRDFLEGRTNNPLYNDDKLNRPFMAVDFPTKKTHGSVRYNALILFMMNQANDWRKLDVNEVDSIKIRPLFREAISKPENMVTLIVFENNIESNSLNSTAKKGKKKSDLSNWLLDYQNDYEKYFITNDMRNEYADDISKRNFILECRKEIIQKEEKKFVENLELKYEEDIEMNH